MANNNIEKIKAQLKYFKGEKKNPFEGKDQNKVMLWFYESHLLNETLNDQNHKYRVDEYIAYGLKDLTPNIELAALIFDRWGKSNEYLSPKEANKKFRLFWKKYYT